MNWRDEQAARDALKRKLEEEWGTAENPKRHDLFDLAWEYGHSHGEDEVRLYYDDMVGLIQ